MCFHALSCKMKPAGDWRAPFVVAPVHYPDSKGQDLAIKFNCKLTRGNCIRDNVKLVRQMSDTLVCTKDLAHRRAVDERRKSDRLRASQSKLRAAALSSQSSPGQRHPSDDTKADESLQRPAASTWRETSRRLSAASLPTVFSVEGAVISSREARWAAARDARAAPPQHRPAVNWRSSPSSGSPLVPPLQVVHSASLIIVR